MGKAIRTIPLAPAARLVHSIGLAALLLATGCGNPQPASRDARAGSGVEEAGVEQAGSTARDEASPASGATPSTDAGDVGGMAQAEAGRQRSRATRVAASIVPLGAVPYDDFTLPVASPDGAFVATQVGGAASWPILLAEPHATAPRAAEIAIYGLAIGQPARRLATIPSPALLGRGGDSRGVLFEAPQPDGSRWIGRAAWLDGEIEWLVRDDNVNAFAMLAPDGSLAWARRAPDATRFELVLRGGASDRESVVPADDDASWLFPTFTPDGRWLLAFELRDGVLRLATMPVADEATMHRELHRTTLSDRGTAELAYQMLAAQSGVGWGAIAASGQPRDATLLFVPALGRVALWSAPREEFAPLAPGSIAACYLGPQRLLVTLKDARGPRSARPRIDAGARGEPVATTDPRHRLIVQEVADAFGGDPAADRRAPSSDVIADTVLEGTIIPRPTTSSRTPTLLLEPKTGTVGILGLRSLDARATTPRAGGAGGGANAGGGA